jgi:hypothetical protein
MFVLCSQHNNKPIQFAVDPKEEITILLLHTHREMWSVSSLCVYVFYFFFSKRDGVPSTQFWTTRYASLNGSSNEL